MPIKSLTPRENKYIHKIVFIWSMLLILAVGAVISIVLLFLCIKDEREIANKELNFISIANQLQTGSDYLTNMARAFAVTHNPKFLKNYWQEVEVEQNRTKAVEVLKFISANDEEINSLIVSKRSSDDLIKTELRSMKLVLAAYDVPADLTPPAVKKYKLSLSDDDLSKSEKITLAADILYNTQYEQDKRKIIEPIEQFKQKVHARIINQSQKAMFYTNISIGILIFILVLMSFLITIIIWIRGTFKTEILQES